MTDWTFHSVCCAQCGASIMRRLHHPRTRQPIIRFFCNHTCKGIWQRGQKAYGEAWLRQKYETEGLDCTKIGMIVGRDPKTVWNWLRGYGVVTRRRGFNETVHFKPGQRSGFAGKKHSDASKAKIRDLRLADGHYPRAKDGRPYWSGVTGSAHPAWAGGATPERQSFYASSEWKAACRRVYARTGGKCERCGDVSNPHIHHVIPFANERTRALDGNLRLLCVYCHRFVHSKANGDRDFLPTFGFVCVTCRGITRRVSCNYHAKKLGSVPSWLCSI